MRTYAAALPLPPSPEGGEGNECFSFYIDNIVKQTKPGKHLQPIIISTYL